MHFSHEIIALLMLVSLVAGFIDAIAGGSGLLIVPALLSVGLPPIVTLGTNKFAASFGVFSSAATYIKRGVFNPLYWQAAIFAVFFGALLGTLATQIFSAQFFREAIPVVIILIAIYMLIPKNKITVEFSHTFKPRRSSSMLLGTAMGFYDGFLGPGTGSVWTTLVMAIYGLDILAASGIARFMNFISNTVALTTFIILGDVDYQLGICLAITLALGSYLGALTALRFGGSFIKPVFLLVVMVLAVRMVYITW